MVDLKEVNWVELTDSDDRTIKLALDRITHFPVREVVISRDPGITAPIEQIYYFTNYHLFREYKLPIRFREPATASNLSSIY